MDVFEAILFGALEDVFDVWPDEKEAKQFIKVVKQYMADNDLIVKPSGQLLVWDDASK